MPLFERACLLFCLYVVYCTVDWPKPKPTKEGHFNGVDWISHQSVGNVVTNKIGDKGIVLGRVIGRWGYEVRCSRGIEVWRDEELGK